MRLPTSLVLFILLLLSSCVGTVQDTVPSYTNVKDAPVAPLNFPGVTKAVAISDTRVEVFFYPAAGGSGKYTYDVQVGNDPYPISIPSDVLVPDYRGLLRTTLTGLQRLSTYNIKVEVRDQQSTVQSKSGVIKAVTTFSNEVADFGGITSAYNTAGEDGKTSIKVRWTPARASGGLTKQPWDPKEYEVVAVDAEKLTPADMDVNTTTDRWVARLVNNPANNEYIMRGLSPGKRYYVRMRCLHQTSEDDVYDPKKRGEQNTNYVVISTISDDPSNLVFQPSSFGVSLAPGEQGLNAVIGSWTAATGVFDHFRLYYNETSPGGVASGTVPALCLNPSLSAGPVYCKRAEYYETTTPITGLKPYTSYDVVLVLCRKVDCADPDTVRSPVRTIITDPSTPSFNGIRDVTMATSLEQVGNLYLKYDPPNFTSGYFDGLIIKHRRTTDGSDPEVEITTSTSPGNIDYNFLTQNTVTIFGIDYLDPNPYCFTIYPFKYDNALPPSKIEFPNNIWKCVQPKIDPPTATQFPGLVRARNSGSAVTLDWLAPTAGIFAEYELYWRKNSTVFIWGDAISEAGEDFDYTNYGRITIDSSLTSISLDNFPNGDFTFGILTHYTYITPAGSVTLRSETNGGILRCTFNNDFDPGTPDPTYDCN